MDPGTLAPSSASMCQWIAIGDEALCSWWRKQAWQPKSRNWWKHSWDVLSQTRQGLKSSPSSVPETDSLKPYLAQSPWIFSNYLGDIERLVPKLVVHSQGRSRSRLDRPSSEDIDKMSFAPVIPIKHNLSRRWGCEGLSAILSEGHPRLCPPPHLSHPPRTICPQNYYGNDSFSISEM